MAIPPLQQAAFNHSDAFIDQVNSIVRRIAQDKNVAGLSDNDRAKLARLTPILIRRGFPEALVSAASWGVTYDTWAADPPGQEGTIFSAVSAAWPKLGGRGITCSLGGLTT